EQGKEEVRKMSILLTAVLAISASPTSPPASASEATAAVASTQAAAPARSGRQLADAAHAALRHWAKDANQDPQPAARELPAIYREDKHDRKMARPEREALHIALHARLDQLCTQITKKVAKDKAPAGKASSTVKSVGGDKSGDQKTAVLAQ